MLPWRAVEALKQSAIRSTETYEHLLSIFYEEHATSKGEI